MIDTEMKKAGVGISIFEVGDSRTLPFLCTLKHRQTNHLALEPPTKITLISTERSGVLGLVQTENYLQRHVDLHLRMRKNRLAPFYKRLASQENVVGVHVVHLSVPSSLDYILEPRHFGPKVFKAEALVSRRPFIIGKEKWTMVRKRR